MRYCVQYDVEFGSGCVKFGYRNEQRTGVRETLITEPVYHYEDQPVYNYRDEVRYRNVTRTVYRDETRTRQVCCRPVTRVITVTRTVRDAQSAVPDASCAVAGYSLNSSSRCERPAGTRLAAVTHRCAAGWDPVSGDPANCERTLTRDPTWECTAGRTIDRDSTPPHCHPDPDEDEGSTVSAGGVAIGGFAGTEGTPGVGEAAVTLSSGFTVSPAGATCSAEPAAAAVTPASGASRTVSVNVAAATTVAVKVTCTPGSHKDTATANFKANPAPVVHDCDDPLGTLSSARSSRTGSLGSTTGCQSVRHPRSGDDRVFYASRHTFRMAAAGWVTIDLANTGSGSDRIDAYVLLLNGYAPDGTGTRLAHDDDSGPPDGRYNADSRIARRFLQPGV